MTGNRNKGLSRKRRARRLLAAAAALVLLIGTCGGSVSVYAADEATAMEEVLTEMEDPEGAEDPESEEALKTDAEAEPGPETGTDLQDEDRETEEAEEADLGAEEERLPSQEEQSAVSEEVPEENEEAGEEKRTPAKPAFDPDFSAGVREEKRSGLRKAAAAGTASYAGLERIPTDVEHPSDGCVMIGVPGKYISDVDAALARINEIRLEACQEGVLNPSTGEPLTMADYVPIRWSYGLEYIARIRAAEASLTMQHIRTNGNRWYALNAPDGDESWAEVIAWNWSESVLRGINQWYEEKADWVNQTEGAVTGHYEHMINPNHKYVGIGTFCSDNGRYYNTTAGEFSFTCSNESRMGFEGDCIQLLEVKTEYLNGSASIEGPSSGDVGEDAAMALLTGTKYSGYATTGHLLVEPVTWSSSDDTTATVSEDGIVRGVRGGTVTIKAECPGTSLSAEKEYTSIGEENGPAVIRSASASFEGKIGVNFYLMLPAVVLEDAGAYVQLTHEEETVKIPVSEAVVKTSGDETWYGFTYHVAAAEIRDTINMRLFDGNGDPVTLKNKTGTNDYTETGVDYALITYATRLLSSSDEKEAALAQALIDYGTAAELFFRGASDGIVSEAVDAVAESDLDPYKGVFSGTYPEGMTSRSLTALFESDNTLRLYYGFASGVDGSAYTYQIDGAAARAGSSDSGWYLEAANVPAPELDKTHAFTISKGSVSYVVKASVLTYARSSVLNGTEERQILGKSLYLYNKAAKAYFAQ